jgi:hypothetical protein
MKERAAKLDIFDSLYFRFGLCLSEAFGNEVAPAAGAHRERREEILGANRAKHQHRY